MAVEAELARLRAENVRLTRLLKLTPQQVAPPGPAQAAFFEASPWLVHDGSSPTAKVAFFRALFAARTDVYAVRYDNPHTGKGGWVLAVRGGWGKGVRHEDRSYLPLTPAALASHLKGEVHIGLYLLRHRREASRVPPVLIKSWLKWAPVILGASVGTRPGRGSSPSTTRRGGQRGYPLCPVECPNTVRDQRSDRDQRVGR